jgi:hypothetical protein
MTTPEAIARLVVAAELHLARCGEKLAQIDGAAAALRAEADALALGVTDPQARLAMRGAAAPEAAAWERWREGRLRDLGMKMAELASMRDIQRAATRRAFGRLQAIRRMTGQPRRP